MLNMATNEELLAVLNDEKVKLLIPVFVYVSVLMIVGTFGNILVLVYYGCKVKRSTNSFFIVALAIFDLSICAITMPIDIAENRFYYTFTNVPACKISRFINYFATNASAATLLAIATDRYRRMCSPLKPQFEIKHARIGVFIACLVASILSWPASVFYMAVTFNITVQMNKSVVLQGTDCKTFEGDNNNPYLLAFNIVHFVIFIIATTTLIVLYSLVGRAIYRYKERRLKYASPKRTVIEPTYNRLKRQTDKENKDKGGFEVSTVVNVSTKRCFQTTESAPGNGITQAPYIESKDNGIPQRSNEKNISRNCKVNSQDKNQKGGPQDVKAIKITVLMFLITVVYIVGYLPYLILVIWRFFQRGKGSDIFNDPGLVAYNIGIRSYFIVSCINPLLYGGFNDKFRHFVFTIFCNVCDKEKGKG